MLDLEDRTLLSTLIVTNDSDNGPGSLRDQIASAASGDTITFDNSLVGDTITLTTGELVISRSISIIGPGSNRLVISADLDSRVIDVMPVQPPPGIAASALLDVTIAGLTITLGRATSSSPHGSQGGGIYASSANLSLTDVIVASNEAKGAPGSIGAAGINGSDGVDGPNGTNGTNGAGGGAGGSGGVAYGGGIYLVGGNLSMTDSTVASNAAFGGPGGYGGAGGAGGKGGDGSLTVTKPDSGGNGGNAGNGATAARAATAARVTEEASTSREGRSPSSGPW